MVARRVGSNFLKLVDTKNHGLFGSFFRRKVGWRGIRIVLVQGSGL